MHRNDNSAIQFHFHKQHCLVCLSIPHVVGLALPRSNENPANWNCQIHTVDLPTGKGMWAGFAAHGKHLFWKCSFLVRPLIDRFTKRWYEYIYIYIYIERERETCGQAEKDIYMHRNTVTLTLILYLSLLWFVHSNLKDKNLYLCIKIQKSNRYSMTGDCSIFRVPHISQKEETDNTADAHCGLVTSYGDIKLGHHCLR